MYIKTLNKVFSIFSKNRSLLPHLLRNASGTSRHLHVGVHADPQPSNSQMAAGPIHHRHESGPGFQTDAQQQHREHLDLVPGIQQNKLPAVGGQSIAFLGR